MDRDIHLHAWKESNGFFDDITDTQWKHKVEIHCNESRADLQEGRVIDHGRKKFIYDIGNVRKSSYWSDFWQANYEPTWTCPFERRLGLRSDGGKWICDPHRIFSQAKCLIYSVGSADQYDFEDAVHSNGPHCEIHTFEIRKNHIPTPSYIKYHQIGVGGLFTKNDSRYKTLYEIADELGHQKRIIDILKIDIECSEYQVLTDHLFSELASRGVFIRQIAIEIHPLQIYRGKMAPPGETNTTHAHAVERIRELFRVFQNHKYVIYHKEPNIVNRNNGAIIEYGLISLPGIKNC